MKNILLLLRRSTDSYPWLVGVVMVLGMMANAYAKPELKIVQTLEGPTTVKAGEELKYQLDYRCASTTEHCYDVQVTGDLPLALNGAFSAVAPTGSVHVASAVYDPNTRTVTWNFIHELPAGSTGVIMLEVETVNGQTSNGTEITTEFEMSGDNADSVQSVPLTVTVEAESAVTLTKTLTNSNPRLDLETNYKIKLCSENANGRLDWENVTLVDTLQPKAEFVSASDDGVYDSGNQTITWNKINRKTTTLAVGVCFEPSVRVKYRSEHFASGSEIINEVLVNGTPVGESEETTHSTNAGATFSGGIGADTAKLTVWKQGPKTVIYEGNIDYGFIIKNDGNVPLENVVITDTVPSQMVVTSLRAGENNQQASSFPVSISYKTNLRNTEWIAVPGNPFDTPPVQSVDVSILGLGADEYITDLRWVLDELPVGFRSSASNVKMNGFSASVLTTDRQNNPVQIGDQIENTAIAEYQENDNKTQSSRKTTDIVFATAGPKLVKTVTSASTITPGDPVTYKIELTNKKVGELLNPSILDWLNPDLEFESWRILNKPRAAPKPQLEIKPNYNGTGKTLLRWHWTGASAYSFEQWKQVHLELVANLKSTTKPGSVTNQVYVTAENEPHTITWDNCLTQEEDIHDLDGNGEAGQMLCASENTTITAGTLASMESIKWVKGQLDPDYHRHPDSGKTARSGTLDYRLIVENTGNISMTNVVVVDILPFVTDTGVIDLSQRDSAWQPQLIGAVQAGNGIIVKYSTEENPCRTEVLPSNPPGCQDPAWSTILPEPITTVRSVRFDFGDRVVKSGDKLVLTWPMYAPINAPVGTIAWNSFGYVATRVDSGTQLLPSEPIKVGIEVDDFEPAVLGDYVWIDANEDGIQNGIQDDPETGLNNVRVDLYKQASNGELVYDRFVLTADDEDGNPGYYIFSFLIEGNYLLKFYPPVGYKISPMNQDTGDDDTDSNDSDVDPETHKTPVIFLKNLQHDRRWDMGLIEKGTAALGNYVWFDRNGDGEQNESADNGINDVQVTLYEDDGDGVANIAADKVIAATFTKNNHDGHPGYYLFEDNIKSGQYFVKFSDLPRNANGFTIQGATGTSDPTDSDPGNDGVTEITSLEMSEFDRTWDAGIIKKPSVLALGNRVWLDANENSTYDAGEKGIDGVKVNLYWDVDDNGEFTPGVDKQVTSMNTYTDEGVPGYYLFKELVAGDYIVQIDPSNFSAGKPLAYLLSSMGAPDPDPAVDHDDNGNSRTDNGVVSYAVTLTEPSDPTDEEARTNLTVDFGFHKDEPRNPQDCSIPQFYALHDGELNNTQFFTINPYTLETTPLGPLYEGYDIEALDRHPITGELYATSGDDTGCIDPTADPASCERLPHGHLYKVDPNTGALTSIGSTGFGEVSGISFHPITGELWAWADREGMLTIDLTTGEGTLVYASDAGVEALTWDNEGEVLYAAANTDLWAASDFDADMVPQDVRIICGKLPGQVEALDMAKGNVLLFAMNKRSDLNIYGWKIKEGDYCPPVLDMEVETPAYYDIEAITWPNDCVLPTNLGPQANMEP
ncbi:MAG: hypothetical protein DRQ99_02075 [Candidatus Parabeggiatoa sp. nov. 3]|nr:MAG: hypothetical protein DRQ99_02075 [Gammaproteobacteria bacterium]